MAGIEPNLYVRLQETLLKCNEFKSDSQLKAIFVDSRIIPWKNQLSITATPQERVQAVIALLSEQTSHKTSENGLVLLLRVLSKQIDSEAKLHHDLVELADELETTKLQGKKPKPANEIPTQGSGMEIPDRPGCYYRTASGAIIAFMLSLFLVVVLFTIPGAKEDIASKLREWELLATLTPIVIVLQPTPTFTPIPPTKILTPTINPTPTFMLPPTNTPIPTFSPTPTFTSIAPTFSPTPTPTITSIPSPSTTPTPTPMSLLAAVQIEDCDGKKLDANCTSEQDITTANGNDWLIRWKWDPPPDMPPDWFYLISFFSNDTNNTPFLIKVVAPSVAEHRGGWLVYPIDQEADLPADKRGCWPYWDVIVATTQQGGLCPTQHEVSDVCRLTQFTPILRALGTSRVGACQAPNTTGSPVTFRASAPGR